MNRILSVIVGLLIAAGTHYAAYRVGVADTQVKSAQRLANDTEEVLNNFVAAMQTQTEEANNASQRLEQQIFERGQADEQTTKEIRRALKTTANTRVNCVFDVNSMRQLEAARQRAAQAITSGFEGQMSDPSRAGK